MLVVLVSVTVWACGSSNNGKPDPRANATAQAKTSARRLGLDPKCANAKRPEVTLDTFAALVAHGKRPCPAGTVEKLEPPPLAQRVCKTKDGKHLGPSIGFRTPDKSVTNVQERDGYYFYMFLVFDGAPLEFFEMCDGVRDGRTIRWHKGHVARSGQYRRGSKDGLWRNPIENSNTKDNPWYSSKAGDEQWEDGVLKTRNGKQVVRFTRAGGTCIERTPVPNSALPITIVPGAVGLTFEKDDSGFGIRYCVVGKRVTSLAKLYATELAKRGYSVRRRQQWTPNFHRVWLKTIALADNDSSISISIRASRFEQPVVHINWSVNGDKKPTE